MPQACSAVSSCDLGFLGSAVRDWQQFGRRGHSLRGFPIIGVSCLRENLGMKDCLGPKTVKNRDQIVVVLPSLLNPSILGIQLSSFH